MAKRECDICGNKMGMLSQNKVKDGMICSDCIKKLGKDFGIRLESFRVEQIQKAISGEISLIPPAEFQCTDGVLVIDATNRTMYKSLPLFQKSEEIPLDWIVGYSYVEDEKEYGVGHVLGNAAVGGMLFGGAGAVIGSVIGANPRRKISYIGVDITFEVAGQCEIFKASMYKGKPIKASGMMYESYLETAKKLMGELDMLIKKSSETGSNSNVSEVQTETISAADEIRKFKGLLDDGIITQEEFDAKKKELLGL